MELDDDELKATKEIPQIKAIMNSLKVEHIKVKKEVKEIEERWII